MISLDKLRNLRKPDLPRREVYMPTYDDTITVRMLTHGEVEDVQAIFAAHPNAPTKAYPSIVAIAAVDPDGAPFFPSGAAGVEIVRAMPWPDVRAAAEVVIDISGLRADGPKDDHSTTPGSSNCASVSRSDGPDASCATVSEPTSGTSGSSSTAAATSRTASS